MGVVMKKFVRAIIKNPLNSNELLGIWENKYDCWVLPGGKVEIAETPIMALFRELKEELGSQFIISTCTFLRSDVYDFSTSALTYKAREDAKSLWEGYIFEVSGSGDLINAEPEIHHEIKYISWDSIHIAYNPILKILGFNNAST